MQVSDILAIVEELSDEELDTVYRRCERIRRVRTTFLRVGTRVKWQDKHRNMYEGTIEKVNIKTVTLRATDHPRYNGKVRVPLSWISGKVT